MQKISDEYSLDDWRRFEPDTSYAMMCAHERAREKEYEAEIERLRALVLNLCALRKAFEQIEQAAQAAKGGGDD